MGQFPVPLLAFATFCGFSWLGIRWIGWGGVGGVGREGGVSQSSDSYQCHSLRQTPLTHGNQVIENWYNDTLTDPTETFLAIPIAGAQPRICLLSAMLPSTV